MAESRDQQGRCENKQWCPMPAPANRPGQTTEKHAHGGGDEAGCERIPP